MKQKLLWSVAALRLVLLWLMVWLTAGFMTNFSEAWYRWADAPIFWLCLILTLMLQRNQSVHIEWMEHRLAELEEKITGRRPREPEE